MCIRDRANTLCSLISFRRVIRLTLTDDDYETNFCLLRILLFCGRFSKVEAPDEIYLRVCSFVPRLLKSFDNIYLASLPNLKSLLISRCVSPDSTQRLFLRLPDFASLTELALPELPDMTDWGTVTKALTTSKTLERVGFFY